MQRGQLKVGDVVAEVVVEADVAGGRVGIVAVGGDEGAVAVCALDEGMSKDLILDVMSAWSSVGVVDGTAEADVMSVIVECAGGSR